MHADAAQLFFNFDFVIPHRGALSIRQVAACLGRIGAATKNHPNGKPNDEYVMRLIEEGKLVALVDVPKNGERNSYRITASSLRLYIAQNVTQRPADYQNTLQNAALNLPPSEMRAMAVWLTRTVDEKEEKFRDQTARATRK